MNRHLFNDLGCVIPVDWKVESNVPFDIAVRIFEEPLTNNKPPACIWGFNPIWDKVKAIVINLTRLDAHSVRFETENGLYPASRFSRTKNSGLSTSMYLDIVHSHGVTTGSSLFECKLAIKDTELIELKRRLEAEKLPIIEWFFVELTNICNFRCDWCPQKLMSRNQGFMSIENAKVVLEKIAAYKSRNPMFSLSAEIKNPVELHVMGDPLLHPKLFEIVQYGHNLGLDFCIATNGLLLTPENIDKILESEVRYLILSLSTADPDSYMHTGSSVDYQKIVGHMQNLIKERYKRRKMIPRIEISYLNTKHQTHSVATALAHPDQVRKSLIFWSDFVRDQEHKWDMVIPHHFDDGFIRWESALDDRGITVGNHFEVGHNIYVVYKHTCNFANSLLPDGYKVQPVVNGQCLFRQAHRNLCIYWDGKCSFCSLDYDNAINIGNVLESDIESIWGSERMNRVRGLMDNEILIEPLCQRCLGTITEI